MGSSTRFPVQPSTSPPSNSPSSLPNTTRSRSTSDPARLPSSLDSEVSDKATLEERLTTLEKGLKAEGGSVAKGVTSDKLAKTVNGASTGKGAPATKATRTVLRSVNTQKNGGSSNQKTNGTTSHVVKGTEAQKTTINSSSTSPCTPVPMPKHLPSKPIDQLSSAELKALSYTTVPHLALTVLDPTNPTAKPILLFKSYPLPLLTSISPRITNILQSRTTAILGSSKVSTLSTSKTLNSNPNSHLTVNIPTGLVLHSSTPTALHILLRYTLLASHHGSMHHPLAMRILSIPLDEYAFYKYSVIVADCIYLGFHHLQGVLIQRMERIAARQVHSNDVGVILSNDSKIKLKNGSVKDVVVEAPETDAPRPNSIQNENSASHGWVKELMVQSVATALWEGRLQYQWKYNLLRREHPDFDRDVRQYMAGWT